MRYNLRAASNLSEKPMLRMSLRPLAERRRQFIPYERHTGRPTCHFRIISRRDVAFVTDRRFLAK